MTAKTIIQNQFDYNNWANEMILAQAARVSEQDFSAPSVVEGRSLHQVLVHLVRTERVWRLLVRDGDLDPRELPTDETLPDVAAVTEFARAENAKLKKLLDNLTEDQLVETIEFKRWDGVMVMLSRQNMLQHLAFHSMQHRTEAAVLVTQYGFSPGDIDYLFYTLQS